jgi:hypothetical protein
VCQELRASKLCVQSQLRVGSIEQARCVPTAMGRSRVQSNQGMSKEPVQSREPCTCELQASEVWAFRARCVLRQASCEQRASLRVESRLGFRTERVSCELRAS